MMFIKEIHESDVGVKDITNATWHDAVVRLVVRGIVMQENSKLALIHHEKLGSYSLPGGAVDGDDFVHAFQRECLEETGCVITNIVPLGMVRENKVYDGENIINTTLCFSSTVVGEPGDCTFSSTEVATGDALVWMSLDEAKNAIRGALLETEDYRSLFELHRDLFILEEYTNRIQSQSNPKVKELEDIAKNAQYSYIMLKSEFDALVRRTENEAKEGKVNQLVELVKKLAPMINQLGQTVEHMPTDLMDNTWASGVKLVYDNVLKTLDSLGITRIPTIGQEPDMELHEPLSVEPVTDDAMKGKITQEFQPGYVYEKDGVKKVIVAAKVIVGQ